MRDKKTETRLVFSASGMTQKCQWGQLHYMIRLCQAVTICDLGFIIYLLKVSVFKHLCYFWNHKKTYQKGVFCFHRHISGTYYVPAPEAHSAHRTHGPPLLLFSGVIPALPESVFLSISRAGATLFTMCNSCAALDKHSDEMDPCKEL